MFVSATQVMAASYYVDYVAGADDNIGTDPTTAWQHCPGDPAATGIAGSTTLNPGDTVYFKGGEAYVLTAGPFGCDGNPGIQITSGTAGAPVTYNGSNSWGTGAAQLTDNGSNNKLIALGSGGSISNVVITGFNIGPIGGTTNLTLVDPGSPGLPENPGWGIQAGNQNANGPSENVVIQNCNFSQLGYWQNTNAIGPNSLGNSEVDCPTPSCGIYFSGLVNSTISNCTFQQSHTGLELFYGVLTNVEVVACDFGAYEVWGFEIASAGGGSRMDYMRIHNNTVHDIGWAYVLPYYQGYGVGAYHCDMFFDFVTGPGAYNGANIDFYNNTFYNTPPYTNGSATGCIYLEGNVSANVYNNLFNVPAMVLGPACVSINCDQPYSNSLVRVLNNTFVVNAPDNGSSVAITWGGAPPQYDWPTDALMQQYNNIEYDFSTYPAAGGYNHLLLMGNVNKSTIPATAWTLDHNDYLSDRPADFAVWGADGVGSYGEFGMAFMQSQWGWEKHGLTDDPQFVSLNGSATNAIVNNYQLQPSSTCVGAGANLSNLNLPGLNADIQGNPRPTSGPWDLGAYEYNTNSVPPPVGSTLPAVALEFSNIVQICTTKAKIDHATMTTNFVTTCKVGLSLAANNSGTTNSLSFPVLLWIGQGSAFDPSVNPRPVRKKVKALRGNETATIRLTSRFIGNQTGTFLYATDTNNNVLASAEIPGP